MHGNHQFWHTNKVPEFTTTYDNGIKQGLS